MRPDPRFLGLFAAGLTLLAGCADPSPLTTETAEPSITLDRSARGLTVLKVATREPDVLATVDVDGESVIVNKSGYGSGMTMVPGSSRDFYLLTDRGPNYDGPGSPAPKRFPDPAYAPRIYRAHMSGERLRFDREIVLTRPDGVTPLSGLPIPAGTCGSTLERAETVTGEEITPDPFGLDPEGIVALADGTFWLSDEYGPFVAHYDANGRELERLSPCPGGGLPEVYKLRRPNRGMEGLAVTPDGQWLVGIMQSPLENPSRTGVRGISRATRVLFRHLITGETREYVYLLERANLQGNSEILALSNTRFLVIERDGGFLNNPALGAATLKHIYEFDITGATDVSTLGALGAAPINGKTIEQASAAELTAAGVAPVRKTLRVDLLALGYPHDKPEGLALAPGGMLFVVNDDDFSIVQVGGRLTQKLLAPMGMVDTPSVWQIRLP